VPFALAEGAVSVYEDVYAVAHPGGSGADRVLVKVDSDPSTSSPFPLPVVESVTYNLAGDGGEFGQKPSVVWSDSWYPTGTTLDGVLGKSGERDGLLVLTGEQPVTIEWPFADASGGGSATVSRSYGGNMTFQYTGGVSELLGFQPAANGTLSAKITAGKARVALTHNNNRTNDSYWSDLVRRLPESHYRPAFGVDYGHPERYMAQGQQTHICDPSVIDSLRGKEQGIGHLGQIYFWIKGNFTTWSAGGSTIGQVTVDQLLTQRRLAGCHDWGLVFAAAARELGYPAVMVDTVSITWAGQLQAGQKGPYVGHVFVEVFVNEKWVLVDSTNNWYVETGYDPTNPVIPLRMGNDGTGPGTYGLYVMRKGVDTWGYGIQSNAELQHLMEDTARQLKIDGLVYPGYVFQRFQP
jgi:hypothetical protein